MPSSERPAPTIVDVARAAGVSKSLVSLAIRGDAGVSDATRQRILAAAADLGYRSNALARGLARGRTQIISVLVSDLRNTYHAEVTRGVEQAAASAGLGTIIGHGQADPAVLERRLDEMLELGVDGTVVVSAMLDAAVLDHVAARHPLVMVGRPFVAPNHASVVRNHDERGARLATAHLRDLGHERVVHLASSRRAAASARREAYAAAMLESGLTPETLWADEGGIEALLERVGGGAGPTACFAGNDRTAVQLLHAAGARGVGIPGDLSIVGYDNSEVGRLVHPAITTVDQPREQLGREAMRLLLARMGGEGQTEQVTVEPQLVVRRSSAPPPG